MATNTLAINISQALLPGLASQDAKVCLAIGVDADGGRAKLTLVAATKIVAPIVSFDLKERYGIAATQDEVREGVRITASTRVSDIKYGEGYTLEQDWQGLVQAESGPRNGFAFTTKIDKMGILLYQEVDGRMTPIYASDRSVPSGHGNLVPSHTATVWISSHHETSSMISDSSSAPCEVDFSAKPDVVIEFDSDGQWKK